MASIKVLERSVAERIAAGEVVERPASVAKELVENALDAGSSFLAVRVEGGGLSSLTVTDDGCGMSPEDARLSIERFATSKISSLEDLERLGTLGFRGEALPSIAAVSRLEILTRPRGAILGTRVLVEGGKLIEFGDAGCPEGTRVSVTRLFFNTPARRKFLKSPTAEGARITELVGRMALGARGIRFCLTSEKREILNFPHELDLPGRLSLLWGVPADRLIEIRRDSNSLRISGFLSSPEISRPNRMDQILFVNGRLVKSQTIAQAVAHACSGILPAGRFPLLLLFIEIEGKDLDVNIHPTKQEVRFLASGRVFTSVRETIASALAKTTQSRLEMIVTSNIEGPPEARLEQMALPIAGECFIRERGTAYQQPGVGLEGFRLLSQLWATYIVAEKDGDLWVVDQHAAHERLLYNRLRRAPGSCASQELLFPVVIDLSAREAELLEKEEQTFRDLGFSFEHFGKNSFLLRSLPAGLSERRIVEIVRETLQELLVEEEAQTRLTPMERAARAIACRGALQAGEYISPVEAQVLMDELKGAPDAHFCPHGRPTHVRLGKDEMARLFQRK